MALSTAPDPEAIWSGFRRASIAAIILALSVVLLYALGAELFGNVVLAGATLGWLSYVAAATVPAVVRLVRHRHRQARQARLD
jgi:hypothetical protein